MGAGAGVKRLTAEKRRRLEFAKRPKAEHPKCLPEQVDVIVMEAQDPVEQFAARITHIHFKALKLIMHAAK